MVLMQAKESYFLMQSRPGFYRGVFIPGVYMDKVSNRRLTARDQIIMVLLNRGYVIVNTHNGYALAVDLRLQKAGCNAELSR